MNVIDFSAEKAKKEQEAIAAHRELLLGLLDDIRTKIEQGEIDEFVVCSMGPLGMPETHIGSTSIPSSIGLFEIGKFMILSEDV